MVTPVTAEDRLMVHDPVPPAVVQGLAEVKPPGPESMLKLIWVPSGAFAEPVPSLTLT